MRSVSGVLNRIVLAVCGLLITAAALWVVASGISLDQSWPTLSSVLAKADTRVGTWAGPHAHWLLPAAALGSVLLIAFGLVLLIKQVPRKAAASPLRLTGSDGTLLATLSPDVIAQALSERAEDVPGVQRCSVCSSDRSTAAPRTSHQTPECSPHCGRQTLIRKRRF